jgi:hypothetical protein
MVLLPTVNLLEDGLANEVPDAIEVVIRIDDAHEILVVAALDTTGDGDLREDLLLGLRNGRGGGRHDGNIRMRNRL